MKEPAHFHDIFNNYQRAVQHLLTTQVHPTLPFSQLEQFRDRFSGHAYPCRFPNCHHSIDGFNDSTGRTIHESKHMASFTCLEPNCQYPPFVSSKALKRHQADCHIKSQRKLKVKCSSTENGAQVSTWQQDNRIRVPEISPLGTKEQPTEREYQPYIQTGASYRGTLGILPAPVNPFETQEYNLVTARNMHHPGPPNPLNSSPPPFLPPRFL